MKYEETSNQKHQIFQQDHVELIKHVENERLENIDLNIGKYEI